jgi:hypothetical protein
LIGTLNVLFASVMMLCGACSGASMIMQVAMAPLTEGYQKAMQETMTEQAKKERQARIDALQAQEDAATTEEEKAQFAAQRQTLEQRPAPEIPMLDMMAAYRGPQIVGYLVADFASGLVFNALLFASGIGLLAAKSWGRKLGVWVAALKIVRLVAVYGFAIIFVVPVFSQKMGEAMEKMTTQIPQKPGGPPMPPMGQTIATVYGIGLSSGAVAMIIFGAIYPIIMLWVLTRPKVKVACGERAALHPADSP